MKIKSTTDKDVKEQAEKIGEDNQGKIEVYYSPDSSIQENRYNGDTTVFQKLGNGRYHVKEFKNRR